MIKIRLEKAANGIIFQILSMPEQIRLMDRTFTASNGYVISSSKRPEFIPDEQHIYVIGDQHRHDQDLLVYRLEDYTNTDIENVVQDILTAFREFTGSSTYKALVNPSATEDFGPNTISFDNGNIVIRLEKVRHGIIFQVIKMPERLRNMGGIATPYLNIVSTCYPELKISTLHLIGNRPEEDHVAVVYPCGNDHREDMYKKVIDTIQTMVETPQYQQLVQPPEQVDENVYTFI